jgi:hypothetical protein
MMLKGERQRTGQKRQQNRQRDIATRDHELSTGQHPSKRQQGEPHVGSINQLFGKVPPDPVKDV